MGATCEESGKAADLDGSTHQNRLQPGESAGCQQSEMEINQVEHQEAGGIQE